ncbi:MAG: alpha/beta hydrolase fold domain-containing protein [Gammaproteobacteria bacterium]|nr:alpha/beta hydrolase fold domain-containing protein [Gammaproteobacteria bacterium]
MSDIPNIDPEMAAAMAQMQELVRGLPVLTEGVDPMPKVRERYLFGRRYWNHDAPELAEVVNETVVTAERVVPIRIYRPSDESSLPVLVFSHGGGFVVGNLDSHDKICRLLALHSGAAVIAVDYALAPEFKFPRPLEEVRAVLDALPGLAASYRLDAGRVALGGDSAGASISLGVALELRDANPAQFQSLRSLLLYYGNFGLGVDSESARKFGTPEYGLDVNKMKFYRASYVAEPAHHDDPRLNQLRANLQGLPPTFLAAAGLDPLLDNVPALAEKLAAVGVSHQVKIYDGVLHGFLHLTRSVAKARQALAEGGDALRTAFN